MTDLSIEAEFYRIDQPFYWYKNLGNDKVFPIYHSLEEAISAAKFEQSKCLLDRFTIKKYSYIYAKFSNRVSVPVYRDPGTLLSLCANAVYTYNIPHDNGEVPQDLKSIMKNLDW